MPLLAMKLRQPRVRASIVSRARLTDRLNAGLSRSLTLVSAPVGFGKTTLVSEWLAGAASGIPAAWLSLDEEDNDLPRFLSYLVAALSGIRDGVGLTALGMLRSHQVLPARTLLTSLLNDLASSPDEMILVLDEYQEIDAPAVHDAVAFLITNLPPQVHLVIATRSDPPLPLSRLRARDQLVEIRGSDLLFTIEEAETFLNEVMGLSLNAGDVAALQSSTEGWIVGLQLIAVSIQGRRDVAGILATVTGAHRYIVDYLVEEVLSRQSAEMRQYLLRTSILTELSGPLCDAVTGRNDSAGTLVSMERDNLFVTPLDDERRWYRYHHLFRDCLSGRLVEEEPDSLPELHRRASEWYAGNGQVDEAIGHAVAAQDFESAARLVEEQAPLVLGQGGIVFLLNWANRLPDSLVRSRPHLSVLVGAALALGGQLEASESYLESTEAALAGVSQPDAQVLQGRIAAIRASVASQRADAHRTVEHASHALSRLPSSELFMRSLAAFNLGDAHLSTGDVVPAGAAFAEAVELSLATGSLHMAIVSSAYMARTEILRGRLREAEVVCERALKLVADVSSSPSLGIPTLGMLYAYIGHVRRERGDLEGAGEYLGRALELGEQSGYVDTLAATYWGLARLRRAQADVQTALAMIERAIEAVRDRRLSVMRRLLLAERADLLVAMNRLEDAEIWAREHRAGEVTDFGLPHERECLSLVRLRLARDEPDEALQLLSRLLGPAEAAGRFGVAVEILTLQALALDQNGELPPALAVLERALALGEPEGYVRTFADHGEPMARLLRLLSARGIASRYAARLLAAIQGAGHASPTPEPHPQSPGVELLTPREVEVLRLLADGAHNQRIAEELTVSVGTVKAHVSHILGKIGVDNRTAAVSRAREMGLLKQE